MNAERRFGVFIASSRFPAEPRLARLKCPENDVDGLCGVLTENGDFDIANTHILKNAPHHEVLLRINQVLRMATKDDLVLVYYAGHGKQDINGRLHLATSNTEVDFLESTSIRVEDLRYMIANAVLGKIVLILDCCYSGAAGNAFLRGSVDDQLQRISSGSGIYVLTASTALQVAQERESDGYGVMTRHIIEGVRLGLADLDRDGLITMDELYHYVHRRVLEESQQTPERYFFRVRGEVVFARTSRTAPIVEPEPSLDSTLAIPRYRLRRCFTENNKGTLRVAFSPAATLLLTAGGDGRCRVYDMRTGTLQTEFTAHAGPAWALSFSTRGDRCATGGGDCHVRIARFPGVQEVRRLTGHTRPVLAVAFSPDGALLASGGFDGIIRLWNVASGELVRSIASGQEVVHTLTFSPDGKFLASGGEDSMLRLWPVAEDDSPRNLRMHRKAVLTTAFSADGLLLASAGRDGFVRVWDTQHYQSQRALEGHSSSILSVVFGGTPRLLASSGGDGSIQIWNPATGQNAQQIDSGQRCVHSLAISTDCGILASGGSDQTVKIWEREQERRLGRHDNGGER